MKRFSWFKNFGFLFVFGFFQSCEKVNYSKDWEIVFEEDFSNGLDTNSVWRKNFPWFRFNYNQIYLNKNASIREGKLNLVAKRQEFWGKGVTYLDSLDILHDDKPNYRRFDYSSGMLFLNNKYKFGKFEIRCKIPKGKGLWPAFWLYGACGEEIDIFEFDCEFTKDVHTARHKEVFCDDGKTYHFPSKYNLGLDFSSDFHIYSLEWTNNRIAWYIDESRYGNKV